LDKEKAKKKYGKKRVFAWRRSYDQTPPLGESLKDMYHRTIPYFKKRVMKEVKKNKNVILVSHGNTLRAIIKYVENISDENIPYLEVQTAKPIIYSYSRGKLKRKGEKFSFERATYWNAQEKIKTERKKKRKKKK
jgi:2,3-bisphosphoglycerate-dependent phosphoglycerate mutase